MDRVTTTYLSANEEGGISSMIPSLSKFLGNKFASVESEASYLRLFGMM